MKLRLAAAIVLFAIGVTGIPSVPISGTSASASVREPSDKMKDVVKPVVKVVGRMSMVDRIWLQTIYGNAARVVESDGMVDPKVIVTTEGLRAVHVAILKFIWRGMANNKPGEYEGLSEAINEVMADVLGDVQRPLTPELRQKAVELFDAIAWAGLGRG